MAEDKAGPESEKKLAMRVDNVLLRELAKMLSDNDLTEIEVEDGDRKIKVRRDAAPVMAYAPAPAPATPVAAPAAAEPAAAPAAPVDAVKSPMVGTAFLSPEPGAKPFITVGGAIKKGDTLMIIEAMKVMNPILAPKSGKITHILIADSQAVEFDQPLVVIE